MRRNDDIQEIDIEDFHLGQGTLQDKRDRVLRLVNKMKDDEVMREKFQRKIEAIRNHRKEVNRDPNAVMNQELQMLEMMYNPDRDMYNEAASVSNSDVAGGGVYIQRNVNLAGQYQKYAGHRR